MLRFYTFCVFLAFIGPVNAQDVCPVKPGKVSPEDFKLKVYSIDSSAAAVVVAETGSSVLVGNEKGWFSLEHKVYRRVHILNKNGFDVANVTIPLYFDATGKEKVLSLKASTYNLEDDGATVTVTKLNTKQDVFQDKVSENRLHEKFTLPNVKEGSIIEYEYTLKSDFLFNFQPWVFQGSYPRLWSEYNVSIPYFYNYTIIHHGYLKFDIEKNGMRNVLFSVRDHTGSGSTKQSSFNSNVEDRRWVIKNAPSIKDESYVASKSNLIAKVEFQLAQTRTPLAEKKIMGTWQTTATYLLEHDSFGAQLGKNRSWLDEATKTASGTHTTALEKAKNIYYWVQKNFKCTKHSGVFTDQSLKETLQNKSGSLPEINLLLVAMLRQAGIKADPVILSTRANGYTYEYYPVIAYFNYVIAQVRDGEKSYYLDATMPGLGFNKLHFDCYNGHARVISPEAPPVYFYSDSLIEKKYTKISLQNDKDGDVSGMVTQMPSYFESLRLRENYLENPEEKTEEKIAASFGSEYEVSDLKIASLDNYEKGVEMTYKLKLKPKGEAIIYFSPFFNESYKTNPFKSAERNYPVEMPYGVNETFLLDMDIPEGYEIDDLPKPVKVKLNNEGDGLFEYFGVAQGRKLALRYRLVLKRATYLPEEYNTLRDFFSHVVNKHSEQVVFKKKQE